MKRIPYSRLYQLYRQLEDEFDLIQSMHKEERVYISVLEALRTEKERADNMERLADIRQIKIIELNKIIKDHVHGKIKSK